MNEGNSVSDDLGPFLLVEINCCARCRRQLPNVNKMLRRRLQMVGQGGKLDPAEAGRIDAPARACNVGVFELERAAANQRSKQLKEDRRAVKQLLHTGPLGARQRHHALLAPHEAGCAAIARVQAGEVLVERAGGADLRQMSQRGVASRQSRAGHCAANSSRRSCCGSEKPEDGRQDRRGHHSGSNHQ